MKVELYYEETIETIIMPVSEISAFVSLMKDFGFEDSNGEVYKYRDASICESGFVVYLDKQ